MNLEPELIQELKEAYDKVAQSDGKVTTENLKSVFDNAREPLPQYKIREICDKQRKNKGDTISFDEFTKIFEQLDLNKAKGFAMKKNISTREGVEVISGYEQTAAGTVHTVCDSERRAFSNYINEMLADNPHCKRHLPIDPESDQLFKVMKDGIILCYLVNLARPDTIDPRAIITKNLNNFNTRENLTLALVSCQSIGLHVINVEPSDVIEERKHLICGVLWQAIKESLLNKIDLFECPNLACLLYYGETLEDLRALPREQLLLRWVNYHLTKARCQRDVTNFGKDFRDSIVYASLEDSIMRDHMLVPSASITCENNIQKRAKMVIDNAKNAGITAFVMPDDIVNGNESLNLAFVANMFNKYPCLEAVQRELIIEETREEKTYRNWMNSLEVKPFVNYIYSDLTDGIIILQLLHKIDPRAVNMSKVNNRPFKPQKVRILSLENCNYAVEVSKKLNFSLPSTSGDNIVDSNRTLVLGLVWQLMSRYTLQLLQQISGSSSPITEAQIIQWANDKLASGTRKIHISSFKDPAVIDSSSILGIVDCLKPNSVDWSLINSGSTNEERLLNAKLTVSLCRRIGAKVYALPEDIVEGKTKMVMTIFACLMIVDLSKK